MKTEDIYESIIDKLHNIKSLLETAQDNSMPNFINIKGCADYLRDIATELEKL